MIRNALQAATDFVANHNRITLLVMAVVSAAVLAGIPMLDTGSQAGADPDSFDHIERVQKMNYVDAQYTTNETDTNRTVQAVYVWKEDGNALSRTALIEELQLQQALSESDAVRSALHEDGIVGLSNLVATRVADGSNPDLAAQIEALDGASDAAVADAVETTLAEDPRAARFLPPESQSGATSSEDRRLVVTLDVDPGSDAYADASEAIDDATDERSEAGFFAVNQHSFTEYNQHFFGEMAQLVLPVALLVILVVLAFSYRDLVDIVVGMTGVGLSVAWMFGIMGWLGVSAGFISIIPAVLITGLSIDFGFHVFNRYREQRGPDEGIREPMSRGTRLVATALVLVTLTAAIGFLSNLTNPLPVIRDLGVSITLGVVSAFVIFLTVVPAMKVGIDGLLERFGFDRRKLALGRGRYLAPALRSTVTLARRAAPAVLVLAVLVSAAGGLAWAELDREEFEQDIGEVAEWKQQLPGPLGWEVDPWVERYERTSIYQPAGESDAIQERILVEGEMTRENTLVDIQSGIERIRTEDESLIVSTEGGPQIQSPTTVMQAVARQNESFAAVLENHDENGDGVPDTDLEAVYDAFYAADTDAASRVLERTNGEYRSALVTLPLDTEWTERSQTVATLETGETEMERNGLTVTLVGSFSVNEVVLADLIDGILETMIVALTAIVLVLAVVFRVMHGSATLGAVVAIPIALVVGLVVGAMYLLELPLNLLTALLMSLVIGLGVDYNIHIGDRFADELREGKPTFEALEAAVAGTGGALLGSTLTSAGAFSALLLVPVSQFRGFATIVVVALLIAFLVSVVVLPSALVLWTRYLPGSEATQPSDAAVAQD
jgi:predicted RND superfamily exporter protein